PGAVDRCRVRCGPGDSAVSRGTVSFDSALATLQGPCPRDGPRRPDRGDVAAAALAAEEAPFLRAGAADDGALAGRARPSQIDPRRPGPRTNGVGPSVGAEAAPRRTEPGAVAGGVLPRPAARGAQRPACSGASPGAVRRPGAA